MSISVYVLFALLSNIPIPVSGSVHFLQSGCMKEGIAFEQALYQKTGHTVMARCVKLPFTL